MYQKDRRNKLSIEKVLVISNPEYQIHNYFLTSFPDWQVYPNPVATIAEMWNGLGNASIPDDQDMVIFTDEFIGTEEEDDFIKAIALFAPSALVVVLYYSPENKSHIEKQVEFVGQSIQDAPFYAIEASSSDIGRDFDTIIGNYAVHKSINSGGYDEAAEAEQYRPQETHVEEYVEPEPEHVAEPEPAPSYPEPSFSTPAPVTQPTRPTQANTRFEPLPPPPTVIVNTKMPELRATPINTSILNTEFPNVGEGRGAIIASSSAKGGSGKTSVAVCTAATIYNSSRLAAEAGLREKPLSVVLVDMDVRDGQIGFLLGEVKPSAMNIFLDGGPTQENVSSNLIYNEELGIHALLAPTRGRNSDYLTTEFYHEVIVQLSKMFDVVVLDTSVNYLDSLLGEIVLPIADAIMYVTTLAITSVYGMNRWMEEMIVSNDTDGDGNLEKSKVGVVINQSSPEIGFDESLLSRAADGAKIITSIPVDMEAMTTASNNQKLMDILYYHPTISPAYHTIFETLFPDEVKVPILKISNQEKQEQANNAAPTDKRKPKKRGLFNK